MARAWMGWRRPEPTFRGFPDYKRDCSPLWAAVTTCFDPDRRCGQPKAPNGYLPDAAVLCQETPVPDQTQAGGSMVRRISAKAGPDLLDDARNGLPAGGKRIRTLGPTGHGELNCRVILLGCLG